MAPSLDFYAFFAGLSGWQILGTLACGLVGSIGVAFVVDRFIGTGQFR